MYNNNGVKICTQLAELTSLFARLDALQIKGLELTPQILHRLPHNVTTSDWCGLLLEFRSEEENLIAANSLAGKG